MLRPNGLLRLAISFWLMKATLQYCYRMKYLSFDTTETPNYRFTMQMHANETLSAVTHVIKAVPTPMWHLVLVQHTDKKKNQALSTEATKTLYNATYKVCEFWRYVKRIRLFNNVAQLLFTENGGNMSLKCPLAVGTYVMQNVQVPPDTGILRYMYWPNTIYTLYGTVYSQKSAKVLEKMCSYEINATVLKLC